MEGALIGAWSNNDMHALPALGIEPDGGTVGSTMFEVVESGADGPACGNCEVAIPRHALPAPLPNDSAKAAQP